MKTVDQVRKEALALSASERAGLAHDLIMSLDDPAAYELSPEQEAEIRRRVRKVKAGKATGQPGYWSERAKKTESRHRRQRE